MALHRSQAADRSARLHFQEGGQGVGSLLGRADGACGGGRQPAGPSAVGRGGTRAVQPGPARGTPLPLACRPALAAGCGDMQYTGACVSEYKGLSPHHRSSPATWWRTRCRPSRRGQRAGRRPCPTPSRCRGRRSRCLRAGGGGGQQRGQRSVLSTVRERVSSRLVRAWACLGEALPACSCGRPDGAW